MIVSVEAKNASISVINLATGDNSFIFYTNTTAVGTRFNATVWIADVTDLFAYEVGFVVDDAMLKIAGAWLPKWDVRWVFTGRITSSPSPVFFDRDTDGVFEEVWIGDEIVVGATYPKAGDAVPGWLCVVEFEILLSPEEDGKLSSNLIIDSYDSSGYPITYLLDSNLDEIPIDKINGQYEYRAPPPETHLPGDINRDGKVDIRDIALAATAYGSYPGHPKWNPIADENGDNKIDLRDLVLIAKNFGKTYT